MCPPAPPSPAGQGSLVQRELSRPKAATEGLPEVAGHFGDALCRDPHPFLPSAPQTLCSAPLARAVDGAFPPFVGADAYIGPPLGTAIAR